MAVIELSSATKQDILLFLPPLLLNVTIQIFIVKIINIDKKLQVQVRIDFCLTDLPKKFLVNTFAIASLAVVYPFLT